MAVLKYTVALRNAQQNAIYAIAGDSGTLKIYDGIAPATPETALSSNTLLGTLTMNATAFSPAANGQLVANAITQDGSADASSVGGATFFRLLTSGGTVVMQGDITATGGSGAMTLNTVTIVQNGPISCTGFAITRGNA